MEHDPSPDLSDGEYGVVRIPDAWHVASLACFVAALGARFLVGLIPRTWSLPFYRPVLPGLAVLVLASLGVGFGLLGLRSPRGRETARVAIFLNTTVLVLAILAAMAFFYILPG
jgi:acyl dehydratase